MAWWHKQERLLRVLPNPNDVLEQIARMAGLKEGDLLRTFNGQKLTTRDGMKALLAEMASDDKLTLEITRDGKDETIELRLGKR